MKTNTKKNHSKPTSTKSLLTRPQGNIADVHGMLEDFRVCATKGFSHENWTLITRIYHALSSTLFQPEREILSEVIRETYHGVNETFINGQVDRVKSSL